MGSEAVREFLQQRLALVEGRIAAACRKAGRRREEVTLVAVTKSVGADVAAELHAAGLKVFAESRPQELWRKQAALPASVEWHMIGHLQTNKVGRTLPLVRLIHSVDSVKLLRAIDQEAGKQGQDVDVLLEVNVSREPNKYGFAPADLPSVLPVLGELTRVRVRGLMTMAAYAEDAEACRPTFAELRELRDRLAGEAGPPHGLDHLSMGMSNDYPVAIEEGATLVRLGTTLFEGLEGIGP